MGRITKDDRCLIKGLRTEKTPQTRLNIFLLSIAITFVVADGSLTSINNVTSILAVVCFTR